MKIDQEKCVACGECLDFCPMSCIAKSDTIPAFKTAAETRPFLAEYTKGFDEDLKYIAANK